jgi:thiosulfate/3-mercaptopyruvate sulfurtransferase
VHLPGSLVDAGWLARHGGRPGLVVADVRWYLDRSGREAYEEGHLPGAVFVDVDRDLAGPIEGDSGRHPLPRPEVFGAVMERLGIGDGTVLVAYDDVGGSNAARLWWMLAVTGHPAAVLDGGLAAWPGPLEAGPPPPARTDVRFTAREWPAGRIADAADVDGLRRSAVAVVLDARARERYRGEIEPIDPVAGHIPGALSAPWAENVDPETGRFRSPEELRRRYERLGAGAGELVVYCGSGVTSCHDLLALEVAGLPGARLYVGSWSGWVADRSRPVARGPEAG